jgi:hypothetical protein
MFKCAILGCMSKPGEKSNKLVLETREKVYFGPVLNEETGYYEEVEIGRGFEIVKEVNATDEGVRLWMSQ